MFHLTVESLTVRVERSTRWMRYWSEPAKVLPIALPYLHGGELSSSSTAAIVVAIVTARWSASTATSTQGDHVENDLVESHRDDDRDHHDHKRPGMARPAAPRGGESCTRITE
jgi:hypothetical protein